MSPEQARLAKEAADEHYRVVSPQYAELLQEFGSLALNGATVEALRQDQESRTANLDLIRSFAGELPKAEKSGSFKVSEPQTARLLQSSVIWGVEFNPDVYDPLASDRSSSNKIIPYFVVGSMPMQTRHRGDADISLLLASASVGDSGKPGIYVAPTWKPELEAIEAAFSRNLSAYSDDQLKAMLNKEDGQLYVGPDEPDSVVFSGLDGYYRYYAKSRRKETPQQRAAHSIETVKYGDAIKVMGGPWILRPDIIDKDALSDEALAKYDVMHRLNELATAFDKKESLKSLIDSHTVEVKDPIDQLLESSGYGSDLFTL